MSGGRGPGMFGGGFQSGKIYSGDYLMKVGLSLPNNSELTSAVIELTEVK
jgi:hypothetical protein